jgi:hypothetical protein
MPPGVGRQLDRPLAAPVVARPIGLQAGDVEGGQALAQGQARACPWRSEARAGLLMACWESARQAATHCCMGR